MKFFDNCFLWNNNNKGFCVKTGQTFPDNSPSSSSNVMSGSPSTSGSQNITIQSLSNTNGLNSNSHNSLQNGHQSDMISNGHNSDTSIPSPSEDSYKIQSNPLPFKRESIDSDVNPF